MTRVKRGVTTRARHNKMRLSAKGFRLRSSRYKQAKTAVIKAGQNAYVGRKLKKRAYRVLWIARINAACKTNGINYSRLIEGLTKKAILVDRKILADIAVQHPEVFTAIVEKAKA